MDIVNSDIINTLDKIRYADGKERLIYFFISQAKKDLRKAADLLNREDLSFTTLFLLHSAMNELGIFQSLSLRNKIAIEFIDGRELNKKQIDNSCLSAQYVQKVHSVLKWILVTGAPDDGLSNEFDELLDTSAALLTIEYRDRSVLPLISDMIFIRNKKGFFIHDLVWAFFESRDVKGLMFIGNRLQSEEPKDVELACRLLCFVPGIDDKTLMESEERYREFVNWIEENNLFLCFTGESFQLTGRPMTYTVNLEAKYLCKIVSIDTGDTLRSLSQKECELLDEFKLLEDNEKNLLSRFSLIMHQKNMKLWDEWIRKPFKEQLRIARSGRVYND